ncbi:MAG: CarD family transcriptional regulator [Clostridia bacterium]|nr:CarD family transcriptional regulator [Clostridia bacterium]
MFKIGDNVMYPMHGAGVIVGIEKKEILGEMREYFVLQISKKNIKVLLPIDNLEITGIRNIVSASEADDAINFFKDLEDEDNANWNQRYRENMDKLKSGTIKEVAYVAKTLLLRDKKKSLSNAERKILSNAKSVFISELEAAKNMSGEEIETLLGI